MTASRSRGGWAAGPTGRPGPAPEAGKRIRSRASTSFAGWLRSAPVLRWRPVDECLVCGSPNVVAGGRCRTCDRFLKRTGRDRSTDEIERPLYHAITRIRGRAAGLTADFVAFVAAMVLMLVVFLYIVVFKTPTMSAPLPAATVRPTVAPTGPVLIPGPTKGP